MTRYLRALYRDQQWRANILDWREVGPLIKNDAACPWTAFLIYHAPNAKVSL